MKKFKVLYPNACIEVPRDEDEIFDIFTDDFRSSSACVIAASKLNVGQTVKVCGVQITRID